MQSVPGGGGCPRWHLRHLMHCFLGWFHCQPIPQSYRWSWQPQLPGVAVQFVQTDPGLVNIDQAVVIRVSSYPLSTSITSGQFMVHVVHCTLSLTPVLVPRDVSVTVWLNFWTTVHSVVVSRDFTVTLWWNWLPELVFRDCSVTLEWGIKLVFRDFSVTLKWDVFGRRSGDRLVLSACHRVPSSMSCLLYCGH
jgi:hypothetical protein